MQEHLFDEYMTSRNLAEATRSQRIYALKRIERSHGVDLDAEFDRDRLASILKQLSYTAGDERAGAPNPSKLDIEPDRLLSHLRWYRSHLSDYARFLSAGPNGFASGDMDEEVTPIEEEVEQAVGKTFGLERDLQLALRANLNQLEPGLVQIDNGIERKVDAGFIDILAKDQAGVMTVIELKAETAKPESVAQILAYMGCIRDETGHDVRGILVAGEHHPRVVQAARAIPNLSLRKYRFRFHFE